mmetsp:Transcript_18134/g.46031  ORF Transcript_18134/g.46031 Transcript_18134/m.46031 type:complete len:212 (-) Transcript_18134:73-708(-)
MVCVIFLFPCAASLPEPLQSTSVVSILENAIKILHSDGAVRSHCLELFQRKGRLLSNGTVGTNLIFKHREGGWHRCVNVRELSRSLCNLAAKILDTTRSHVGYHHDMLESWNYSRFLGKSCNHLFHKALAHVLVFGVCTNDKDGVISLATENTRNGVQPKIHPSQGALIGLKSSFLHVETHHVDSTSGQKQFVCIRVHFTVHSDHIPRIEP